MSGHPLRSLFYCLCLPLLCATSLTASAQQFEGQFSDATFSDVNFSGATFIDATDPSAVYEPVIVEGPQLQYYQGPAIESSPVVTAFPETHSAATTTGVYSSAPLVNQNHPSSTVFTDSQPFVGNATSVHFGDTPLSAYNSPSIPNVIVDPNYGYSGPGDMRNHLWNDHKDEMSANGFTEAQVLDMSLDTAQKWHNYFHGTEGLPEQRN